MSRREDPIKPPPQSPADENADRRWVLGAFAALVLITVFFVAIGHIDMTGSTTGQSSSAPSDPGPSAGSTSLPKGPGH